MLWSEWSIWLLSALLLWWSVVSQRR
ncbi:MAG: IPTL-CTERM sorting domain-containing protein [Actinobacteria bacterium]|nr:IPTL-CTERM sorting domain-containing protein [Actinomycetota bacterium]